jgi:hypothetical protein
LNTIVISSLDSPPREARSRVSLSGGATIMGSLLDGAGVSRPCPADWDAMTGDDRVRFCGLCRLSVYNLSGMSRAEAEALLECTEGRLCIRLFRRPDGTVLTQDCPVGLVALKRRVALVAAGFAAFLSMAAGAVFGAREAEPPVETEKVVGVYMGKMELGAK